MTGPARPALRMLISAVEPSGDLLGAALMAALKKQAPDIQFTGCGGPLMAGNGLESLFPIEPFSVIGPVGALRALPAALSGARRLAEAAQAEQTDAAILIDSWSFSRLAAERIKRASPSTKLFKYVAPQIWGSRPKRAETVARLFDGVLTLFEFENPYFESAGAAVAFVGSSTFQEAANHKAEPTVFRARYGLADAPLLAVLPGSRKAEVRRLAEPFGETARLMTEKIPDLRLVVPVAQAVRNEVRDLAANWPGAPVFVEPGERFEAFAAANAALAASGTVTTELAISKTPMIVGYCVGPVTASWIRHVATTPYASVINIAAGREVVPEFLQEKCRPTAMAQALVPLFTGPARDAQLQAFPPLLSRLGVGGPPAATSAAAAIMRWIGEN